MSTKGKTGNKKTSRVNTRKKKPKQPPKTAKKAITTNTRQKKPKPQPKTAKKAPNNVKKIGFYMFHSLVFIILAVEPI